MWGGRFVVFQYESFGRLVHRVIKIYLYVTSIRGNIMRIKKYSKILLPVLAMLWAGESSALGMGFTSGSADEEWTDNESFVSTKTDYEVSNFGFVLDTNVAKNRLFNYRFSLTQEENKSATGGIKYEGIGMTHDFGFRLFSNQHVRVWLGPRLNTAFYDTISVGGVGIDGDVLGISFGPVLGVNVHVKDILSFSLTTGILQGGYVGDYTNSGTFGSGDIDNDIDSSFMNLSVIFRIRDQY